MNLTYKQNTKGHIRRLWVNKVEVPEEQVHFFNLDVQLTDTSKLIELSMNEQITAKHLKFLLTIIKPETDDDWTNLRQLHKEIGEVLKKQSFLNKQNDKVK